MRFNNWEEVLTHMKEKGSNLTVGIFTYYIDNCKEHYESNCDEGCCQEYYGSIEEMFDSIKNTANNDVSLVNTKK